MGKGKRYVVDGATIKCSMGSMSSTLKVTSNNMYKIDNRKVATIMDCVPGANLFPPVGTFGTCKPFEAAPPPGNLCTPVPLGTWLKPQKNKAVGPFKPLLENSCLRCGRGGGEITISNPGESSTDNDPQPEKCPFCDQDPHPGCFSGSGRNTRGDITYNIKQHLGIMKSVADGSHFLCRPDGDAPEGHHLICCEAVADPEDDSESENEDTGDDADEQQQVDSNSQWSVICDAFSYDINCPENGALFPGDMLVACHHGLPRHKGNHASTVAFDGAVRKKYVEVVRNLVNDIKNRIKKNKYCTNKGVQEFHNDMDDLSDIIFEELITFNWTITADGFDYAKAGINGCARPTGLGCYKLHARIVDKMKVMKADTRTNKNWVKGINKMDKSDAHEELSKRLIHETGICSRNHANDGCHGNIRLSEYRQK